MSFFLTVLFPVAEQLDFLGSSSPPAECESWARRHQRLLSLIPDRCPCGPLRAVPLLTHRTRELEVYLYIFIVLKPKSLSPAQLH